MANRFIGSVLSSRPQANTPFASRASTGTYFNQTGTLVTAPVNQPRLNYTFNGQLATDRYSALFTSASSNYLSTVTAASNVGTGNFTMEFWWKANSTTQSNYSNIINQGFTGSPSNGAFSFKVFAGPGSNILNFTYFNSGISDNTTTANVNDLAWHHIAASRTGTSLGIYVDGVLNTTITLPASFNMGASGGTTFIGYNPRDASYINGHVKDLRIISGQALYSGTFTPPTAPLTRTTVGSTGAGAAATLTGTVILLTCQNVSLNDASSNNYTITNTNSVTSNLLLPNNLGIDTSGTGWTQPSLLIEPASTNLLPHSQDISQTTQTSATGITVNQAVAPDGTTTADYIWANATAERHFVTTTRYSYSTLPGAGTVLTGSIFAKAAGNNFLGIMLSDSASSGGCRYPVTVNLTNGAITNYSYGASNVTNQSATATPVGNGWYRIVLQMTTTRSSTGGGAYMPLFPQPVDGTAYADGGDFAPTYTGSGSSSGVYIWGWQMETRYGATSYIPTTSSTVTRAADVVGPGTPGIYKLEDRQNTTAIDDQFTVQSFTATGSTTWTAPADVTSIEVLVVAGGGSGGSHTGNGAGGGGAGGLIYNTSYPVISGATYPVVIGAGGISVSGNNAGNNGSNSIFGNIVAIGGGGGGRDDSSGVTNAARSGGSGGGAGANGNGKPGIAGQGYPGGNSQLGGNGSGGGGAGGPGGIGMSGGGFAAAAGGAGVVLRITGSAVTYATGGAAQPVFGITASAGSANTGNGGQGHYGNSTSGAGGSGIVIVRYQRTPRLIASTSNAAVVVQKFTVSNTWTVPAGVTSVEALVVAGGGGGGYDRAGGGGAGGIAYSSSLTVTPGSTYTIGVGAGGTGGTTYRASNGRANQGFGSGIGTGAELITNGTGFTATTGWSATTATLSVPVTGVFRILPNSGVNGTASQSITTTNGVTYVAVVRVINDITKNFRLYIGTSQVGNEITSFFTSFTNDSLDNGASGAGFYSVTFTAVGSITWINMQIGGGTSQATDISYISVRQASLPTVGGGFGTDGAGGAGGSGGSGGGTGSGSTAGVGGAGTAGQGNSGGANGGGTGNGGAGGGGGAGSSGSNGGFGIGSGGNGGTGLPYAITGNLEYYAGGGGGGAAQDFTAPRVSGYGGIGGGGQGGNANTDPGKPGAPNTGGGGGGGSNITQGNGGNGGSGVVILRYRVPQVAVFQDSGTWICPAGVTSVQTLIVAGGGGGGAGASYSQLGGGGGGAGGLIYDNNVPVTPGVTYPITVGQGGVGGVTVTRAGTNGQNSSFSNLVAIGGGYGGVRGTVENGGSGGSGGAAAGTSNTGGTPIFGQGNVGAGSQVGGFGGGGGGAGASGIVGQSTTEPTGGSGGAGLQFSISGTATFYAGGGSSGAFGGDQVVPAALGGGGTGGANRNNGFAGAYNTGGGGGAGGAGYRNVSADTAATGNGAIGGSGIVIIRWIGG